MAYISLTNGNGVELRIAHSCIWFVDFPLMLDQYEKNQNTATSIQDVYNHLATKYGITFLLDRALMGPVQMQLSEPGRKYFVKVSTRNLCKNPKATRDQVTQTAASFGLVHCPSDTPLFTRMQTRSLVGGGQMLLFPRDVFLWEDTNAFWGIHNPLDQINLVWPKEKDMYLPETEWRNSINWAFEIPE